MIAWGGRVSESSGQIACGKREISDDESENDVDDRENHDFF